MQLPRTSQHRRKRRTWSYRQLCRTPLTGREPARLRTALLDPAAEEYFAGDPIPWPFATAFFRGRHGREAKGERGRELD